MTTTPRPQPLTPNFERIPPELRDVPAWVLWQYQCDRKGKWKKVPKTVKGRNASTINQTSWAPFESVRLAYQRGGFDGVGIVLTDGIAGVDIDKAIDDDGAIEPWAKAALEQFSNTYREKSPSGRGYRIFARGRPQRCGKGGPEDHLEIYAKGSPRYLTVTGHALGDVAEIADAQPALDWLHVSFMEKEPKRADGKANAGQSGKMLDVDVIRRAREARNGAKFLRLWGGDTSGHSSPSEADAALIGVLAFWTQDAAQLDRLFRCSGLMRDKWNERRSDSTYGADTIANILRKGGKRFVDGGGTDDAPKDRAEQLRPLTVAEIRAQSGPRWLVRDVIEHQVLAVIWGAPGSGKTFFTLDLACAVARDVPAMGKRVNGGGVIYIAAEGRLKPRLDAYCTQHGITDADLVRLRGIPAAVNLSDAKADILPLLAAMQRAAGEMGGVVLVVIDTLNAVMAGADENTSEGMGGVLANARRIKEALGATVAIVHHGGKDEARGARGHSSLHGAIDSELHIEDAETHRTATVCKLRDGEAGAVFAFKLHQVDLGASADPHAEEGERESSCVVEMLDGIPDAGPKPAKRDVALDALREAISEHGAPLPQSSTIPPGVRGVRLPQWLARWRLRTGNDYSTDQTAQSAFRRERAKLLAAGLVVISDPFVWLP